MDVIRSCVQTISVKQDWRLRNNQLSHKWIGKVIGPGRARLHTPLKNSEYPRSRGRAASSAVPLASTKRGLQPREDAAFNRSFTLR